MSAPLPRIDIEQVAPEAEHAIGALDAYVSRAALEPELLELVRARASQLNGCQLCIDMHTRDARQRGESERRLYLLTAWGVASCYTERERAALAWTEAVTLVAEGHVPDAAYEFARRHFDERELVDLTMAIIAVNAWNRLAVALRMVSSADAAAAA